MLARFVRFKLTRAQSCLQNCNRCAGRDGKIATKIEPFSHQGLNFTNKISKPHALIRKRANEQSPSAFAGWTFANYFYSAFEPDARARPNISLPKSARTQKTQSQNNKQTKIGRAVCRRRALIWNSP